MIITLIIAVLGTMPLIFWLAVNKKNLELGYRRFGKTNGSNQVSAKEAIRAQFLKQQRIAFWVFVLATFISLVIFVTLISKTIIYEEAYALTGFILALIEGGAGFSAYRFYRQASKYLLKFK